MFVCRGGQEQTVAHGDGYDGVHLNAKVQPNYDEVLEENRRLKDNLLRVREQNVAFREQQLEERERQYQGGASPRRLGLIII